MAANTAWLVNDQTKAKTTAWVRAVMVLLAPGGRERTIPGVRIKNNTAVYKNIIVSIFEFVLYVIEIFLFFLYFCIFVFLYFYIFVFFTCLLKKNIPKIPKCLNEITKWFLGLGHFLHQHLVLRNHRRNHSTLKRFAA